MDAARDRIVEIAVITLDENLCPIKEYVARVNPGIPLPEAATKVHGITDADVADCPRFAEIAAEVRRLIGRRIIIAHNAPFDIGILSMEFERAGIEPLPLDAPAIDTLQIEREVNRRTLEACFARYAGRKHQSAHAARDDVLATIDVLRGQMRQHGDSLPAGLHGLVRESLARHFGRETVLFLDPNRRFYRDKEGHVRFNFGRHRGDLVSCHPDFVSWMVRQDFTPRELAIACHAVA